jgi:hypothetical protein
MFDFDQEEFEGELLAKEIKAKLAQEERALNERQNAQILSALLAVPSRSSAIFTLGAALASLLTTMAAFGAPDVIGTVSYLGVYRWSVAALIVALFGFCLVLAWQSMKHVLKTLTPPTIDTVIPEENFIEIAL